MLAFVCWPWFSRPIGRATQPVPVCAHSLPDTLSPAVLLLEAVCLALIPTLYFTAVAACCLLLRCLCTALSSPEDKKKARAKGLASYLLESILQLGPTFIKVGQLSSTRSDLFPAEFVEELSKLQVSG